MKKRDVGRYCDHLERLYDDLKIRFSDIINLIVPRWIMQPFLTAPSDIEYDIQEEFIELQNDEEAKAIFNGDNYCIFWCRMSGKYPNLWSKVDIWIISFPTSYLVERGFSAITLLLQKQRNRLLITKRGDLRLNLTKMTPNITNIVNKHQYHPSH